MTDPFGDALTRLSVALANGDDTAAAEQDLFAAYMAQRAANPRSGQTTTALPWPSPTDPVAAGADAIRALAEAIDPRLGGGYRSQTDTSTATIPTAAWTRVGTTVAESALGTDVAANGGGMTCVVAGWYRVDAYINWQAGLGTALPTIAFAQLADSGPGTYNRSQVGSPGSFALIQTGSWVKRMSAGETVSIWVLQSSGSNQTITNRRLAVHRVAG